MNASARLPFWGVSLLVVIGLHAAVFFWALFWHATATPVELPPAAMIVELEPLVTPPKPTPPPQPEVKPVEPEPQPKIIEAPKPRIVIAKPKPKPPKPVEPKPEVKLEPAPPQDVPPVATRDEKAAAPQRAPVSAPTQAQVSWQSKLLGHLARYKRYPEDARRRGFEGVNRLRFVVDANGKVLSFSLVGRSGSAALDRATLEMIRRAQPLPAPPADMLQNGQLEIVAPFVYSLDRR